MKKLNLDIVKEEIDGTEEVWKNGELNLKSFDLHDELNPLFWDDDGRLDGQVRLQLLEIAADFFDTLNLAGMTPQDDTDEFLLDKYVKDIQMLGSLASFNYSSYADIDLHLVMDESALIEDMEGETSEFALNLLKGYFMKCKNAWNLLHGGLKIHGYDVELYVQDVSEENAANGVFSLVSNAWIKKPKKMSEAGLDRALVSKKVVGYIELIDAIEKEINGVSIGPKELESLEERLKEVKTKIVKGRREALGRGSGEMCNENIIFKALRRTGHIGKINDMLSEIYDRRQSVPEE